MSGWLTNLINDSCIDNDCSDYPQKGAFHTVVWGMVLQCLTPYFSALPAIWLMWILQSSGYALRQNNVGFEILGGLGPTLAFTAAYIMPFSFAMFYLFMELVSDKERAWIDNTMIWFIYNWISNLNLQVIIWSDVVILMMWAIVRTWTVVHFAMFAVINFAMISQWYVMMDNSVEAIHYIDEDWDKIEDGDRLWPTAFYWFGIKDRDEDDD